VSERPFKPGEIEIDKFEITNYTRSKANSVGLSQITPEFSYYESIFSPTISADVIIEDATNLLNDLPVIGDEDIELSFHNKRNPDFIDVDLRSYRIGERVRKNERTIVYAIYCSSQRGVRNPKTEILSSFTGKLSDTIRKNFKNFVEIEPTKSDFRYIATGETFFDTMRIFCREAQSEENPSSTYLFYETSDGYHFVTLESLFAKETSKAYYYTLSNIERNTDSIDQDQIISKMEFITGNDLISGMEKGLYGNTTSGIDPLRKVFNSTEFDYFADGFSKTKHISTIPSRLQSNIRGVTGGSSFAQNSQIANEKYFVTDLNDIADIKYIKDFDSTTNLYGRRRHLFSGLETSLFAQAEVNTVRIAVPGDSSRHAGDVIEIYMPEPAQSEDALSQYDKYLAGRFLVKNVRHILQVNKEYVTIMECVKDSLEEYIRSTLGDLPEQYFD